MEGKRFDGYGRVSRRAGRSGEGYISPKVQREGVERWANAYGAQIIEWHFDEDKTGRNQNRPGMREAVRRVETGEVDGLVCLRLNRFARNVVGALGDIQRIRANGGEIVFVEEQLNTSGPTGQLMLTLMLAFAEWEHENYSASFREAKRRAVERGAYVSRTPFGYQRQDDGTIAPHPKLGPIVTEAFRLAAGDSLHAAMRHLDDRAPERTWTTTKVRRLLAGRSYLGETRNGDLVQPNTHQPLVSRAIWEAAQTSPTARTTRAGFPLTGVCRCATCNTPMVGGRGGQNQRTYRCAATLTTHGGVRCPRGPVILADRLEGYLREIAQDALSGLQATISDPDTDTLTLLERALLDAEAELDQFAADMHLRRALGDRYHAHLDSRVEAVEKARSAYREQARASESRLEIRAPGVLDQPGALAVVLRGMFDSILVVPGRGLKVAERVRLVPVDADGATGELGPEQSQ